MIYYPLQLLERAGIESVLVVTGKGHGGQMIDLLGDGRLTARGSEEPLLSLDVTYKVQTQPGGIAQVVGMARDFARDERLVVVLGDNIFERSQSAAIAAWASGGDRAMIFVKDVPDPENFGVVVYEDGRVVGHRREGGSRRHALRRAADQRGRRRALLLPAGRLRRDRAPRAVRARRARDHRRQPPLRAARDASTSSGSRAGGRTQASTGSTSPRSAAASTRRGRTDERRRASAGSRSDASRTGAAGSASSGATARCRSRPSRRTSPSRGRA